MIVCTFHGHNHFVPNYDETTIEVFENIGHAISALFDRYDKGQRWPQPVRYLNGHHGDIIFPFTEVGDYFNCYRIDAPLGAMQGGHIDNDTVLDALTAVHGGLMDYRLTLRSDDDGAPSISVEKR